MFVHVRIHSVTADLFTDINYSNVLKIFSCKLVIINILNTDSCKCILLLI